MKKVFFICFLLINFSVFSQGTPKVVLKDSSRLKLTSLKINVKIIGNFATTTYDMKFYNELDRILEGELAFPLGQGQSVSKFAMDLNGKLRDAVIVEKELARVAYETTVRQNIDPALLEKTSGNNYKARVYPILPKKFKQIVLTYEENLISLDNKLIYELPLGINEKIDHFSLTIDVLGDSIEPIIKSQSIQELKFVRQGNKMTTSTTLKKIKPEKPLLLEIKTQIGKEKILTHRDYFYAYFPLKSESRNKRKPRKIDILWDASYSMKNRNLKNELELLDRYFNYLQNVEVNFLSFNNKTNKQTQFTVTNGNWESLKKEIQLQTYDGGTNLEDLRKLRLKSNEVLLFSDGLANLGNFEKFTRKSVYTINSLVSANHLSLEEIATLTGGYYINLGKLNTENAFDLLKREVLQYLGIKKNDQINEVYPKNRVNVSKDFMVSGKFQNASAVELQFGYQGKVTQTKIINLRNSQNSDLARKLWAKQKLKHLNKEKKANKDLIISLSKQHHLVTDYTSMLILDRIEDYVQYRIEPPIELKQRYKELLKEKELEETIAQEDIEDRKEELFDEYKDLLDWYHIDFLQNLKTEKKRKKTVQNRRNTNTSTAISNNQGSQIDYSKRVISGIVADEHGGLPGVSVIIKGTTRGTETDFDGKFSINAEEGNILVFSYLGYSTKEVSINANNNLNIELKEAQNMLEEIVVAYRAPIGKRNTPTTTTAVQALIGITPGVQINHGTGYADKVGVRGNASLALTEALYVVNGVVVTTNPMANLKPEEIESIQVLKSADATKIYGNRAVNGLIIITTKEGKVSNQKEIEELDTKIEEKIELKAWNPKTPYLDILRNETTLKAAYEKYLEIRDNYSNSPMFFIDVSDFFDRKGSRELAITVLSNLIEIDLNNYELIKALAYKLEYFKQYDLAKKMYEKVLELRPEDPQSYRDLALAHELVGEYQESFDLLYRIYNGQLLEKDRNERYFGIEAIAFVELSRLVSKYGRKLKLTKNQKKFFKPIPMDVRVVVDWNHNDTDIDLWVIDPKKEKASYQNQRTLIGGRMSNDMIEGYGPEEFILRKAIKGKYKVMIDYYADNIQKISGPTILRVILFTNYGKKNEKRETIVMKLEKQEDYVEVGSLSFD